MSHNLAAFGSTLLAMVLIGMLILMAGCASVKPETVRWEQIYES